MNLAQLLCSFLALVICVNLEVGVVWAEDGGAPVAVPVPVPVEHEGEHSLGDDGPSRERVLSIKTTADVVTYLKEKGMEDFLASKEGAHCSAYSAVMELRNETYQAVVADIVRAAVNGSFKSSTFDDMATFVDSYSNRMAGSPALEKSLEYIEELMKKVGIVNQASEKVPVPSWKRGTEKLRMLTPQLRELVFLGMGQSASTPPEGIAAPVVVVQSVEQLLKEQQAGNLEGKIVVVNVRQGVKQSMNHSTTYATMVKGGALAGLYRSTTTFSLGTPHTRRASTYYGKNPVQIPIGFLSLEDIDLIARINDRGVKMRLHMQMESVHGSAVSRNLFGDLVGREKPEEYVFVMAHTDSWDVGQGAQDDATGIILGIKVIELLKHLNLVPRRTIRLGLWTAEEVGLVGSKFHVANESRVPDLKKNVQAAIEADYSCLASLGHIFSGQPELGCVLREINRMVGDAASSGLVIKTKMLSTDVDVFSALKIPVVSLLGDNGRYFWYHHTAGDTMTSLDTVQLDRCLALWTSTAYILADLKEQLER